MTWQNLIELLIELIVGTLFFIGGRPGRSRFLIRLLAGTAAAFVLARINDLATIWAEDRGGYYLISYKYCFVFLMVVFVFWFSFRVSFPEALFYSSSGYALQNAVHYCFVAAMAAVGGQLSGVWMKTLEYIIFVLAYTGTFFLTKRIRKHENPGIERKSIIAVSLLTLLFTVVFSSRIPLGSMEYMLYYLYAVFIALLVLFLQYGLLRQNELLQEKSVVEQMLAMEKRQHQISEDTIALINLKCHDLKHQVRALCRGGENERMLEEIENSVAVYDSMVETGNDTLDIVMTEKSLRCEKNDIDFSYILDGHLFDFMETVDIYSLFGNALDNAIESVIGEKRENRFISLKAGKQGSLVCLHIENYCGKPPVFENGLPATTKPEEPGYHGYGVKSIRFLAEKYGGYAKMYTEDSLFILDAFFATYRR
ncbi:MAG TPA: ATP-binding protein [Candidatus Mediterraneibacter stercoripullorum]|nr:ATP-binding protein [Candidatus Mediterraneibacter stercoripullorum]